MFSEDYFHPLLDLGVDVEGAIFRCCSDEKLYVNLLKYFLSDSTLLDLSKSIENKDWNEAFTATHSLKGIAGNMGFSTLFQSSAELLLVIRSARYTEIDRIFDSILKEYQNLIIAIKKILGE